MKYSAVIFDLFGTLVDEFLYEDYQSALGQMAAVVGVPFDDFKRLWYETADERHRGIMGFIEDNIKYIDKQLGAQADDMKVREATKIRYDFVAKTLKPRLDALDVLSQLRSRGLKIGLISNCSPETPMIWQSTPFPPLFDVTVFSSSVGVKKPDPNIYLFASKGLGLAPDECIFVDDNIEFSLGASKLGMKAVLLRPPGESSSDAHWIDREEWEGPSISSLRDILAFV